MAKNLSDYWRIDKTRDRIGELASILDGSAKAVELLGGKYRVVWAGQSATHPTRKLIQLDAGVLDGFGAPIPGQVVDVVIGLALHEGGHERWTEPCSSYHDWYNLSHEQQRELNNIHNVLEDAYVDNRLGRISNTLSEYIRAARKALYPEWGKEATRLLAQGELNRDSLTNIWGAVSLYGEDIPDNASQELAGALTFLIQKTLSYIKVDDPKKRLDMAVDTWQWLQQFAKTDTSSITQQAKELERKEAYGEGIPIAGGHTEPEDGESEGMAGEDSEADSEGEEGGEGEFDEEPSDREIPDREEPTDEEIADQLRRNLWGGNEPGSLGDLSDYLDSPSKKSLNNTDAEHLEDYINTRQEDLTHQLDEMGIRAGITKIKNASHDAPSHQRVKAMTARETQKIHSIFSQLDMVDARWRHGLENGKLDGRRLSKVGVGKTMVFKLRDMRDRPSLAVVLLLDVSGSMDWELPNVSKTACIFSEALTPLYPKIWHEVVTYNGEGGEIELSRLASSRMKLSLKGVWHGGGTPSGEAIASALLLLKRRREQRKMVVHFTDGCPESTNTVKQALELCQRDRVDVITISVGRRQEDLYGQGKCEVIRDVSELPNAVMEMMKKIYRR